VIHSKAYFLFRQISHRKKRYWKNHCDLNRDSKSTNDRGPSLVGSLGLSCRCKRFLFYLSCSSQSSIKYFSHTVHYFNSLVPHRQEAGQSAMLGHLSLGMCLWLDPGRSSMVMTAGLYLWKKYQRQQQLKFPESRS
jgi:hypothetical protein